MFQAEGMSGVDGSWEVREKARNMVAMGRLWRGISWGMRLRREKVETVAAWAVLRPLDLHPEYVGS